MSKLKVGAIQVLGCEFGSRRYNIALWFHAAKGARWDLTTDPTDPMYVKPEELATAKLFKVIQIAPGTEPVVHAQFTSYVDAVELAKTFI